MQVVHCFVDPGCPWTWITSRWLAEVARLRTLDVRWRSLSIALRDGGAISQSIPEPYRSLVPAFRSMSTRALRLFEATRSSHGDAAVGRLYTEIGVRAFRPGVPPHEPGLELLADAVEAAGLGRDAASAADDDHWDALLEESLDEVAAVVGNAPMSPTVVVDDGTLRGLSGPGLSSVPTGAAATRLWDAVTVMLDEPAMFELRRARLFPPRFPSPSSCAVPTR